MHIGRESGNTGGTKGCAKHYYMKPTMQCTKRASKAYLQHTQVETASKPMPSKHYVQKVRKQTKRYQQQTNPRTCNTGLTYRGKQHSTQNSQNKVA